MARLVLPLAALVIAATATYAARSWLLPQPAAPQAEVPAVQAAPQRMVMVAAADLAAGEFVNPDSTRWQAWPDGDLPPAYIVQGAEPAIDLVGAVLRRPVAAGEPLVQGNVVTPGDRSFLAAVLDPGMRAVSVAVDEASSNAGLIFPGDRVDLILTQTVELAGDPAGARRVAETVLNDLRIIAMGRRLSNSTTEDVGGGAGASKTVTLEVTPAQAEKVAIVNELGRLAISLRSLAVPATLDPTAPGRRITWDSDASPVLRPENQPRRSMTIMRGDKVELVSTRQDSKP